jgi:hypothetical protein
MKKIVFLLALLSSLTLIAQNGKLGVQFNTGTILIREKGSGFCINSALTYNFAPSYGLKIDGGLDIIGEDILHQLGLQFNLNLVKLANLSTQFGFEIHGGGTLINNGNAKFNDFYIFRGDDMIAIMAGLTPSYQFKKLRILLDASYVPKTFKIDGDITKYFNATLGVAYQF